MGRGTIFIAKGSNLYVLGAHVVSESWKGFTLVKRRHLHWISEVMAPQDELDQRSDGAAG